MQKDHEMGLGETGKRAVREDHRKGRNDENRE